MAYKNYLSSCFLMVLALHTASDKSRSGAIREQLLKVFDKMEFCRTDVSPGSGNENADVLNDVVSTPSAKLRANIDGKKKASKTYVVSDSEIRTKLVLELIGTERT